MTPQTLAFAKDYAHLLTGTVLDVGSFNVNGQFRDVLPVSLGVDIRPGHGVDVVCDAADLDHLGRLFDVVVSSDMLEHAEDWRAALCGMWGVLKDGGYMLLTTVNNRKGRHDYPADYWRFDAATLAAIFRDQTIIDQRTDGAFEALLVVKRCGLNLSVVPQAICEGRR